MPTAVMRGIPSLATSSPTKGCPATPASTRIQLRAVICPPPSPPRNGRGLRQGFASTRCPAFVITPCFVTAPGTPASYHSLPLTLCPPLQPATDPTRHAEPVGGDPVAHGASGPPPRAGTRGQ